jgi:hypothetical protein
MVGQVSPPAWRSSLAPDPRPWGYLVSGAWPVGKKFANSPVQPTTGRLDRNSDGVPCSFPKGKHTALDSERVWLFLAVFVLGLLLAQELRAV